MKTSTPTMRRLVAAGKPLSYSAVCSHAVVAAFVVVCVVASVNSPIMMTM